MTAIEKAIIKTLCYADVFDYPLTREEIHRYLIYEDKGHSEIAVPALNSDFRKVSGSQPPAEESDRFRIKSGMTADVIYQAIDHLVSQNQIKSQSNYYYLPKRSLLAGYRHKRNQISKPKLGKAYFISKYLAKIPTIEGVFVTGALAMENAHKHDDIDLMIITKTNWLWTTRTVVTLLLQMLGVRRKPKEESVNDLVCANMYLDESTLAVPESKRNLYTAHEVVQVKPLFNNHHIYQRFLNANRWINQHLPNFTIQPLNPAKQKSRQIQPYSNPLESLAYTLQHRYMQSKITTETVSHHAAYFHPRDTSSEVMRKYQQNLEKYQAK